jgi:hypothetical protein
MADVMPEQQVVDLDGLEGDAPAGTGDLDAVDKQLWAAPSFPDSCYGS